MKQQMNKILVENYLNHTLPIRMGYKIEMDMENVVLGKDNESFLKRSKIKEEYIQKELEEEINKIIRGY